MADLNQLRDLGEQVRPPSFDSLVMTAKRRNRRTAAVAVACAAAVLVIGAGMISADETDRSVAPSPHPTTAPRSGGRRSCRCRTSARRTPPWTESRRPSTTSPTHSPQATLLRRLAHDGLAWKSKPASTGGTPPALTPRTGSCSAVTASIWRRPTTRGRTCHHGPPIHRVRVSVRREVREGLGTVGATHELRTRHSVEGLPLRWPLRDPPPDAHSRMDPERSPMTILLCSSVADGGPVTARWLTLTGKAVPRPPSSGSCFHPLAQTVPPHSSVAVRCSTSASYDGGSPLNGATVGVGRRMVFGATSTVAGSALAVPEQIEPFGQLCLHLVPAWLFGEVLHLVGIPV